MVEIRIPQNYESDNLYAFMNPKYPQEIVYEGVVYPDLYRAMYGVSVNDKQVKINIAKSSDPRTEITDPKIVITTKELKDKLLDLLLIKYSDITLMQQLNTYVTDMDKIIYEDPTGVFGDNGKDGCLNLIGRITSLIKLYGIDQRDAIVNVLMDD